MPRMAAPVSASDERDMQRRRRRHTLDGQLHGRLLAAVVSFELALFATAWIYLYHAFAQRIDDARDAAAGIPAGLLQEFALVILACCLVNLLVLSIAHHLWAQRVRRMLADLHLRLDRVQALDLRASPGFVEGRPRHRLIELCDRWIEGERRRMLAIRIAAARLPRPLPAEPESSEALDALSALQEAAQQLRRAPGGRYAAAPAAGTRFEATRERMTCP